MHHLQALAHRVRLGDFKAEAEFRRKLQGGLPPLVRRALRTREALLPIDPLILAEADRLALREGDEVPADRDRLVRQIVQRVCDAVVDSLGSGGRAGRALLDTVCA